MKNYSVAVVLIAGIAIGAVSVGLLRTKSDAVANVGSQPVPVAPVATESHLTTGSSGTSAAVTTTAPVAQVGSPPVQPHGIPGRPANLPGIQPASRNESRGTPPAPQNSAVPSQAPGTSSPISSSPGFEASGSLPPTSVSLAGGGPQAPASAASISPSPASGSSTFPTSDSIGVGGPAAPGSSPANRTSAASSAATPVELNIEVPYGAKVPAAAVIEATNLTPPQQAAVNQILTDFNTDVAESGSDPQAWNTARNRADDRYRILFGDAAYNQMTMKAALEAIEEKKTASPAP